MSKCPACGVAIDLRPLWQAIDQREGAFIGSRYGVTCGHCGAKLRVTQRQAIAILLGIFVLVMVSILVPVLLHGPLVKAPPWFSYITPLFGVSASLGALKLSYWLGRLFTRLKLAKANAKLKYPLEWNNNVTKEVELSGSDVAPGCQTWMCRKCREENPGEFELCWKCNEERALSERSGRQATD